MRRVVTVGSVVQALTNQRYFILALLDTPLSDPQLNVLNMFYTENENLTKILGVEVPSLNKLLLNCREVAYLEALYRRSPDAEEAEGIEIGTTQENGTTADTGVGNPKIGSDETP